MKRLFVVLTATVLAVAFAACSASNDAGAGSIVVPAVSRDASATASSPPAAPDEAERYLVAFAANLDSGAGCHYGDSSGCDIYTVVYDDAAGTVSDLQRLTSSSAAEWFPSLSPDGCFVAYNLDAGRRSTATAMHIASGETVSLGADTRFPDWSPDGDALAWASSGATPQNVSITDVAADCDSGSIVLGDTVQVTNQAAAESRAGDPDFFPGGETLAFHIDAGKLVPSQAAVIATDGTGLTELTPVDGSGHVSVRPDGEAVLAGSSKLPVLTLIERTGDGWVEPTHAFTAGRPATYTSFDGRYASCTAVNPAYPSWLDNDRVMFGLQCNESGRVTFAHLFIAGIDGEAEGQLVDLGALVEELAGVDGKSFITASAIPLPDAESGSAATPPAAPATNSAGDVSGTVYLTLVSHNEEPNTRQPNFLANPEFYAQNREILVEIVNLLDEYGAAYNFQSDWNFLQAIARYDTGAVTANTSGMNVLRWMSGVMGVEIDPHS
ncbi:MAG: PD40 domain-containing protein, partial [Dehalococcoidia bacterium]|nr:PD40 domain-containing protein [Dehalococcoidia bacterium]